MPGDFFEIVIRVKKETDEITVSQCVDPQFDLDVLTEGLASLLMVNGKYTERPVLKVLDDVYGKLKAAVSFHDIIKRSE